MSYQEFPTVPSFERAVWSDGKLQNPNAAVKWSAAFQPPAVGTEIIVAINKCGRAVVTGYFVEEGWLGVKCRLLNAPDWHRRQNKGDPTGHAFGAEIQLTS